MLRHQRGQGIVEMAVALPVLIMLLVGLMAAGWIFFQAEAINSAAQTAARETLVEGFTHTLPYCESSAPLSIQAAAQHGASSAVPIDQNQLCAADGSNVLTQTPSGSSAQITVTAEPSIAAATSWTITITYYTQPINPIFPFRIKLTSSSTVANFD